MLINLVLFFPFVLVLGPVPFHSSFLTPPPKFWLSCSPMLSLSLLDFSKHDVATCFIFHSCSTLWLFPAIPIPSRFRYVCPCASRSFFPILSTFVLHCGRLICFCSWHSQGLLNASLCCRHWSHGACTMWSLVQQCKSMLRPICAIDQYSDQKP